MRGSECASLGSGCGQGGVEVREKGLQFSRVNLRKFITDETEEGVSALRR